MRSNNNLFHNAPTIPPTDQGGSFHFSDPPIASSFGGMGLPAGVESLIRSHDVQVQSSEICPKNLIIFDQTDNRRQIMFHPTFESHIYHAGLGFGAQLNHPSLNFSSPMNHPRFNFRAPSFQNIAEMHDENNMEKQISSYEEENSEDIDALLSLDSEDHEDSDDEEVSTARTDAKRGSTSPESCSNYKPPLKRCKLSCSKESSASDGASTGRKSKKIRKMVNALRGIIPGARRMSTVTVLDEAVRHLKSLKLEVKRSGFENIKSYI